MRRSLLDVRVERRCFVVQNNGKATEIRISWAFYVFRRGVLQGIHLGNKRRNHVFFAEPQPVDPLEKRVLLQLL